MDKKELRSHIRKKIAFLGEDYKKKASEKIQESLIALPIFREAESVFVYISTENEPSTDMILKEAAALGKKVYVPKCVSRGVMDAVRLTESTRLTEGFMGIWEPENTDELLQGNADITIVPCMSCSRDGRRLGHGAGFYDIFLSSVDTCKICLCFEELISEDIPVTGLDAEMDAVISERAVYVINSSL